MAQAGRARAAPRSARAISASLVRDVQDRKRPYTGPCGGAQARERELAHLVAKSLLPPTCDEINTRDSVLAVLVSVRSSRAFESGAPGSTGL
ncbi:hypothetical protein NDU88_002332 [Pleurodeles waltl]|uniref:Uncharacterized protein n=1 Tax=Pleurodeles waltl TaxID=8319 RepID=A0AAV7RFG9_PLEWA|nr:hypothetical protein NDU88_002332 [Pleurodeles waltl]